MDFLDPVTVSSNNHFPALMAIGLGPRMARDIAQVHIVDALGQRDFSQFLKGGKGCGRKPVQFILGEKPQKMKGKIGRAHV